MNWIARLKEILGRFWTVMFGDHDFLLGVENALGMLCLRQNWALTNWLRGLIQANRGVDQDELPFVVYIPVDSVHRTYADFSDITSGDKALGDASDIVTWTASVRHRIRKPDMLCNHVNNPDVTLVGGIDYVYESGRFVFLEDPATLNLPMMKTTEDGVLRVYYRLFGWCKRRHVTNDAVSGFMHPSLSQYSDTVWDIHTNGATNYNVKKLLADVTGSVVCVESGAVDHLWEEQGMQCMLAGGHVYTAPAGVTCNFAHGDDVRQGDVLFGDLRVYQSDDAPPATEVPSMLVNTDAGALTAVNAEISLQDTIYTDGTYNVLPLQGAASAVRRYVTRCLELCRDKYALFTDIPDTVNPLLFIRGRLRNRRGCFITLTTDRLSSDEPALDCIRKNTDASAVVTVFVRAVGEAVTAPVSGFTASACMSAIAEYETVKLAEAGAEATQFI